MFRNGNRAIHDTQKTKTTQHLHTSASIWWIADKNLNIGPTLRLEIQEIICLWQSIDWAAPHIINICMLLVGEMFGWNDLLTQKQQRQQQQQQENWNWLYGFHFDCCCWTRCNRNPSSAGIRTRYHITHTLYRVCAIVSACRVVCRVFALSTGLCFLSQYICCDGRQAPPFTKPRALLGPVITCNLYSLCRCAICTLAGAVDGSVGLFSPTARQQSMPTLTDIMPPFHHHKLVCLCESLFLHVHHRAHRKRLFASARGQRREARLCAF